MPKRTSPRHLLLVLAAATAGLAIPTMAFASDYTHPSTVKTTAVAGMPRVVSTTAVPRPHVDAISVAGPRTYAGGLFESVSQGASSSYRRTNIVAFDTVSGAVSTTFNPVFDDQIWAIEATSTAVYVGGEFKTVNGTARPGLVKLDPTTGTIDSTFKPGAIKGRVNDIELVTPAGGVPHLFVANNQGNRLYSLNPTTGANDNYLKMSVTTPVCTETACSWGAVSVYDFAVDPAGRHLVATGNFKSVNGQARTKFFMLDLAATSSTLSTWYYPGFAKNCATDHPRRIANLQGVDWSPNGDAFSIAATGQIPERQADIWYQRLGDRNRANTSVCDAVGRFRLADPTKPQWINYTGGDSVWDVADTGAAVYAQGHFKWMDNPDGYASIGIGDKTSGAPAAQRAGIAAINPATGLALSWNPGVKGRIGGKAFFVTSTGLWIGNDSTRYGKSQGYGIYFAALP